jgi:predicted transcriptional regulator
MRFSLRRRVDDLTYDEIDKEIDRQQHRAEELLGELSEVLQKQTEIYKVIKEGGEVDEPGTG